jgi:hypothetical protein
VSEDVGQTLLACVLNRNTPNCMKAIQILLEKDANPLVKDNLGLDCVAQAV